MEHEPDKEMLTEELKNCALSDLRFIAARIGTEATKDWIKSEFVELPF